MMQNSRFKLSALAIATAMASSAAFATNGYFIHGLGTKANGMGGVGIALPQDSIAAAVNPAGISWTGSRADVGVAVFSPLRDASINAEGLDALNAGLPGSFSSPGADFGKDSGATAFLVPNAGFVMDMAGMTMGMAIYGNGGMNTRYNENIYFNALGPAIGMTSTFGGPNGFAGALEAFGVPVGDPGVACGGSAAGPTGVNGVLCTLGGDSTTYNTLGVNLSQLVFAPTVSTKLGDDHSVGASMLVGYQRFRAYGMGLFKGFSTDPDHLTNQGDDDAWGAGVRLGWTGKVADMLTVGATYSSKIYMQKFDKYKGLFAEDGGFDIPANYGLGISFKPADNLTFAFDVERIMYGDVASIANAGPTADQFVAGLVQTLSAGAMTCGGALTPLAGVSCKQLGNDDGYGFGWDDQTVYKLGAAYAYNDQWTFRAGFNYGESPIAESENLFNVVAPGVVEKHATLGFTYSPDKSSEISVAYMHAFRKDQSYTYTLDSDGDGVANDTIAAFGLQEFDTEIGMSQNSLEVSYGIKF